MNFPTEIRPAAPPTFVLDVAVVASWTVSANYTVYTHRLRSRLAFGAVAIIPTCGPLDLLDRLLAAERGGTQPVQRTDTFLATLPVYLIYLDPEAPRRARPELLDTARAHSLSAVAAAYLELALRLKLPLATSDAALTRAAGAAGVPIFTP